MVLLTANCNHRIIMLFVFVEYISTETYYHACVLQRKGLNLTNVL